MTRFLILLLLQGVGQVPGTKPIASTPLSVPTKLGTTHAKLTWKDKNGNIGAEVISNAQYAAIGASGVPVKPASFVGTAQDWIDTWTGVNGGKAQAVGGRADVDTASKEQGLGTVEHRSNGTHRLYIGDPDVEGWVNIQDSDITGGAFPNITIKGRCGIVTASPGRISGTLIRTCATITE